MKDLFNMMGKMKEVQAKLKEAQDNLVNITAEGESGGGMVKAVANGKKQLIKLVIDKDVVNPQDQEMLQDLIVAAVNKALQEAEGKAQVYLQKSTEGLMPNIPGMDFDQLAQ